MQYAAAAMDFMNLNVQIFRVIAQPSNPIIYGSLHHNQPFNKSSKCFCFVFQLDNADEQAAQVRRELDGRLQMVEQMCRVSSHLGI